MEQHPPPSDRHVDPPPPIAYPPKSSSRIPLTALALAIPLAFHLLLTSRNWSADNLWLDEAYGVVLSRIPLMELPAYLRVDSGPPLLYGYYHILRFMAGESDAAYRIHALLAGVLGLATVWHVARTWIGPRAASYAAWYWASSPLIIHYEREARVYTILALCCLIHIWALQRFCVGSGKRRHIVGIAGALCVALYGHNFGWFLLPGSWLALYMAGAPRDAWRSLSIGQCVALFLYAPWLPILLAQLGETERTIGWIRHFTDWKVLVQTFLAFIHGGWYQPFVDGPSAPYRALMWIAILMHVGVLAFLCASCRGNSDRGLRVVLAILGVLVLGPIVASILVRPMALPGRTDVIAYPCFVLLMAAATSRMPGSRAIAPVVAAVLVFSGTITAIHHTDHPRQRTDAYLASVVEKHSRPGDVVIVTGLARPTLETYLFMNREPDRALLSWPPDMALRLAHLNQEAYERQAGWPERHLRELDGLIRENRHSGGKVVVVDTKALRVNGPLRQHLERQYARHTVTTQPVRLRRLGTPMTVDIYEPGAPTGDAFR